MKKKLFQKLNNQKGSATIEAIISFAGFLFVIFTILSLVNLCRAQMLISSAMDNAAKELSQYSYFYKMSGLQKFSAALGGKKDVGKSHINDVIGSVDDLYGSMVGAIDKTKEGYTNIAEATQDGTLDMNTFQEAYNSLSAETENVGASIDTMTAQFQSVGNNPMLYMKSLVAIASSEGLDLVKSHAIAAPLAKFFVQQQFGKNAEEASKNLGTLGVKNGLSGMNFKMSTVFSSQHEEDVRLVVFYRLTLLQLFDWSVLEVNMCKQSACRAWLAGDDPETVVLKEDLQSATGGAGGEADGSENTGDSDNTDDTGDTGNNNKPGGNENSGETDETKPSQDITEPTKPTQEKVDITNSYWHLGDGGYGSNDDFGVRQAIYKQFAADNHIKPGLVEHDTRYYPQTGDYAKSGWAYNWDYGVDPDPDEYDFSFVVGELGKAQQQIADGKLPENTKSLTYIVYVPNNIPDEKFAELKSAASDAWLSYQQFLFMHPNDGFGDLSMNIEIQKIGGNYDYASGGTQ